MDPLKSDQANTSGRFGNTSTRLGDPKCPCGAFAVVKVLGIGWRCIACAGRAQ